MSTKDTKNSEYEILNIQNIETYKIGLVVSQWNNDITNSLFLGAKQVLLKNGILDSNIISISVPGSFELIFGAKMLIEKNSLDAVIILGSIIRGETPHFDYVCQGVTHGIKDLNIKYNIPVVFGLLTDNNKQQALDRSGGKYGNKGIEAGITALKMAYLNKSI